MRKTLLLIVLLASSITANAQKAKYDLNGDGKVNVADVTDLVNYILTHSNKSCPDGKHPHWIDLGLPSGMLWRCCNEGASTPEAYGGYYQFGQVASAPSYDQIKELLDYTTSVWTTQNGVNGRKFTGSNGGSIFLPAAGGRWSGGYKFIGSRGYYWTTLPIDMENASGLYIGSSSGDDCYVDFFGRSDAMSVRPVR
ncbi:MAG: hypothetical protein IJK50_01285 [Prevotella sp.]|nr:hypothetical protein [Prevotella sp.]